MPRGKKFTAEQIIGKLREAEVGLAQGKTMPEVVRKLGVTAPPPARYADAVFTRPSAIIAFHCKPLPAVVYSRQFAVMCGR